MTAEEAYQLYHHYCLMEKNGCPPREIKNFDKFNAKEDKIYFERFADTVTRSAGLMNPNIFMSAMAKQYKGFFPSRFLISPAAMRIYRISIQKINEESNAQSIYESVMKSCNFIARFCIEKGLDSFSDYLFHNNNLIPSLVKHAYSGEISYLFLGCIKDFNLIKSNYPVDSMELINDFDFNLYRSKIVFIKKCCVISDNLEYIIGKLIANFKNERGN
jgi:hypothetical protein